MSKPVQVVQAVMLPSWTDPTAIATYLSSFAGLVVFVVAIFHPGFNPPPSTVQAVIGGVSLLIAGAAQLANVIRHASATKAAEAQQAAASVPSPAPGVGDAASAAARLAAEDAGLMARVPADFRPDPAMVARLPQVIASQENLFAEALQGATADSPATPRDLAAASGRARTWCHGQLGALMEVGYVTQVSRGQYVPVPGMDIREGMRLVRDRNARLNREAARKVSAG